MVTLDLPCYRDRNNGVRFTRNQHHHDCTDTECRGCQPCPNPHHCTGRRNCTWHVGPKQLVCGRCIGGVRRDLRWVRDLTRLAAVQAINDGTSSEAANLAGPSADYATFSARRRIAKQWIETNLPFGRWERAQAALLDDDDEHHPGMVLKRWATMTRETFGHPPEQDPTAATALAYLDRQLSRIAHDPDQDFPLLRAEIKKVRQHLEAILHNDTHRDRGAPCPTCLPARVVRLELHYAHWCRDQDCSRFHFTDDASDIWRCPHDHTHWWTSQGYADLLEARRAKTTTTQPADPDLP